MENGAAAGERVGAGVFIFIFGRGLRDGQTLQGVQPVICFKGCSEASRGGISHMLQGMVICFKGCSEASRGGISHMLQGVVSSFKGWGYGSAFGGPYVVPSSQTVKPKMQREASYMAFFPEPGNGLPR